MKSFLLNLDKKPIIRWSMLEDGIFYEGNLPEGFSLAVCPTNEKQIIVDIDCKPGKGNGYLNIPENIFNELLQSFHYKTGSGGMHIFLNYTGDKELMNTTSKLSIDLRIGKNYKTGNNGGYVRYQHDKDIRECIHLIKDTSKDLNNWLESLFNKVNYEKEITD